jgi:protein TonB
VAVAGTQVAPPPPTDPLELLLDPAPLPELVPLEFPPPLPELLLELPPKPPAPELELELPKPPPPLELDPKPPPPELLELPKPPPELLELEPKPPPVLPPSKPGLLLLEHATATKAAQQAAPATRQRGALENFANILISSDDDEHIP